MRSRSSITGRFVAAAQALRHGDTTVRERGREITPGLALVLAGYVISGTATNANGDVAEERERARVALVAVGLTLANATDDPTTHELLNGPPATVTRLVG